MALSLPVFDVHSAPWQGMPALFMRFHRGAGNRRNRQSEFRIYTVGDLHPYRRQKNTS
jgi:hypothetical protein